MKKLILLFTTLFIFISCSKNEEVEFISPMIGTFEGTVDYGDGLIMNTRTIINENGTMSWDLFLKDENENYIIRYYWPSISAVDVTDDQTNWLYGKIQTSETKRLLYSAAAPESGLYTLAANEIVDMPIGWNAHYSVMEFDEIKTTYELRNVCVPQEFQLANDELCEGWELWESTTLYIGTRVD